MSQYKSILKATSIFGGTQILQILILLVRTKFIAILIGGTGMGVQAMYISAIGLFVTIFGMGLHTSVVRDLSKANDEGDEMAFSRISKVFKRLLLVLSVLGAITVVLLSEPLSVFSFGDRGHVLEFCFLSLYLIFTLLAQGNQAILTGKRCINDLALSSLLGSLFTLLTSVPFFYLWGLEGIVPGFIVSTFSNYLVTLYYAKKIEVRETIVSWEDVKKYGKSIFVLGMTLSISILIGNLTDYLVSVGISRMGGIKDLGCYNAGMSMTTRIISLVFASLSADYFPRLAASFKDTKLMNETVNEECEVVLHLSTPILALFALCSPILITLLLSEEFQVINEFIKILCFGMFFKTLGYVLGYLSFAKGDKSVYFTFEAVYGNLANLIYSLVLYHYYGLKGIAYGFVLCWILYSVLISIIDYYRYHYRLSSSTWGVLGINTIMMCLLLLVGIMSHAEGWWFLLAILIVSVIGVYNVKKLNQKTGFVHVITDFFKRNLGDKNEIEN